MRQTFNNLEIKSLGFALYAVPLVIGGGIVTTSVVTTRDVDGIGQTWTIFEKGPRPSPPSQTRCAARPIPSWPK